MKLDRKGLSGKSVILMRVSSSAIVSVVNQYHTFEDVRTGR
jgi:hypothetical protein